MDWRAKTKKQFLHFALIILLILLQVLTPVSAQCRRLMLNNRISNVERQMIVDYHNGIRQAVALGTAPNGQPPATNMQEMRWDEGLARRAQMWSMSCLSEIHDNNRHMGSFKVGQNIASIWKSEGPHSGVDMKADFNDVMGQWLHEYLQYSYGGFSAATTSRIGHYSQMIWAETNLIGCGYSFYQDGHKYTKNYICNYGPSGNIIKQAPYKKGRPDCYSNQSLPSARWFGLCVKPLHYTSQIHG